MFASSSSAFTRLGAKAVGTVLVGGAGTGSYLYATDDGIKRSVQAYSTFAPVILHYRFLELKNKYLATVSDEDWEALDEQYATITVHKLGELQGMYSKYGQTAAGLTNTLGDAWIRELRTLENEIPPRSVEIVRRTIEEETGNRKLEETFSEFDIVPLGSASIGQVHRAVLKTTGKEVAVKVQYPEAQELFNDDIHAIRKLCEWFAPEQVCTLDALEQQNKAELDYNNEAKNLWEVSQNMTKHGFQPTEVVVPYPIEELTTTRMLVMQLIPGPKLIDGMRKYYAEYAKAQGTTLKRMETQARQKIELEGIPDRYDGPSASQIASYQKWLRIRDNILNVFIVVYNNTFMKVPSLWITKGWGKGRGGGKSNKSENDDNNNDDNNTHNNSNTDDTKIPYLRTSIPPNTPRIVDTLMRVHGYQLLVDGKVGVGELYQIPDLIISPRLIIKIH